MNSVLLRHYLLLVGLAAAFFLPGIAGQSGQARAQDLPNMKEAMPDEEDTHFFRRILYDGLEKPGLTRLVELRDLRADPAHTVLIVLGRPDALDEINRLERSPQQLWVARFVEAGGTLFVATDQRTDPRLLDFGVSVTGDFFEATRNTPPDLVFKKQGTSLLFCPFVSLPGRGGPSEPALFKNYQHIATNKPSYLTLHPRQVDANHRIEPVAYLPPGGHVLSEFNPAGFDVVPGQRPYFAVSGRWGKGRLLVLADHSIFINGMMSWSLTGENDNIEFAQSCVEWLKEGRTRFMYIEDGDPAKKLDIPFRKIPPPPLIEIANELLDVAEREDIPNRLIASNIDQSTILTVLAFLASLGLVVYLLSRLSRVRHRVDAWTPAFAAIQARQVPVRNAMEMRSLSMIRDSNLYEAARTATRQFFASVLGQATGANRRQTLPANVVVTGGRAPAMRSAVQRLWHIAQGPKPTSVSAAQFTQLLLQMKNLKAALDAGNLTLQASE